MVIPVVFPSALILEVEPEILGTLVLDMDKKSNGRCMKRINDDFMFLPSMAYNQYRDYCLLCWFFLWT